MPNKCPQCPQADTYGYPKNCNRLIRQVFARGMNTALKPLGSLARMGRYMRSLQAEPRRARLNGVSEVFMPRNYAILALLFVAASGCPAVYAGDFVTRASSGYAPAGDEAGRAGRAPAMNESDSAPAVRTPDTDTAPVTATRRAAQVGADDSAGGAHAVVPPSAPAVDGDDKPAPASPHKARALRWQSLLPGVMK